MILKFLESFTFRFSSGKLLNISGVTYKSTSNKLVKASPNTKLLVIRGEKFTLDSSGTKLQLDGSGSGSSLKLSRIDIGGLTYKASQSGAFERDNSHQVRSHLRYEKFDIAAVFLCKFHFQPR